MPFFIVMQYTADHSSRRPVKRREQIRKSIASVLQQRADNYSTPEAFFDNYGYFFFHDVPLPHKDNSKHISEIYTTCASLWPHLLLVNTELGQLSPRVWTEDFLSTKLTKLVDKLTAHMEEVGEAPEKVDRQMVHHAVHSYLRLGVARGGSGPAMHTTIFLLGQDVSMQRLNDLSELLSNEHQKESVS